MRTARNLVYHTFIGLPVEIINSSSSSLAGINGRVIDETKNMLVLEITGKERKIQKKACVFRFTAENGEKVIIAGNAICFRPEERAKKMM